MLREYSSDKVREILDVFFYVNLFRYKPPYIKKIKKSESNKSCHNLIHSNMSVKGLTWNLGLGAKLL